jgi:hypothetical protein
MNVFKKSLLFVVSLLCVFMGYSCSEDVPDLTVVRVQIDANTDEPVRIYGMKGSPEGGVVIRKNFDQTFQLERNNVFSIEARCKDENTLIIIKVWIGGRLWAYTYGNKYLTTGSISLIH